MAKLQLVKPGAFWEQSVWKTNKNSYALYIDWCYLHLG